MAGGASIDWRFVLTIYHFPLSPPLSASVEAFCFSEGEASLQTKERRLPDGRVALVINLGHEMLRVSHREHADQFQSFHGGVEGNLRKRLASRFHLPPHIGSAETRGGVNSLLLWDAPSLLPTGSSEGAWSRLVQP